MLPLVAGALALAAIHPTYAIFVCVPLAGFALARLLLAPGDREGLGRLGVALGAIAVPSGLFFAWLLPVVRDTGSYRPGAEERASGIAHYSTQLDVFGDSFRLAPEAITRAGPVVIAALLAIPLAVAGARRRWGSFVLGGSLAVLALLLVPALFTWLSDTVSLSQSRRLAGFLPLPFALAGAAFVLARLRLVGVALALRRRARARARVLGRAHVPAPAAGARLARLARRDRRSSPPSWRALFSCGEPG